MRLIPGTFTALLTLTLTLIIIAPPSAHAGEASQQLSAVDAAAFRNFTLTEEFLDKYMAVEADIAKDPCNLGPFEVMHMGKDKPEFSSLDKAAAHWDAKPGVHDMLASHDMKAKQMMLGFVTLLGAAMQDLATKYPQMTDGNSKLRISADNMAFFHAHQKEYMQHMRKVGRERMQANGGKMPSCLTH